MVVGHSEASGAPARKHRAEVEVGEEAAVRAV